MTRPDTHTEHGAAGEPDDPYELRPVQNDEGTWDALDASGYGYSLGLKCSGSVQIWLSGYQAGSDDNR